MEGEGETMSQSYLNLDVVWTQHLSQTKGEVMSQSYLNLDVVWTQPQTKPLHPHRSQSYLNLDVVWTIVHTPNMPSLPVAILPKSGCCLDPAAIAQTETTVGRNPT